MQNYDYAGFYQFPVNVCGQYRFAVVSDLPIIGANSYMSQLAFFLGRAKAGGATDIIYLNRHTMPHDDAILWPTTGLTTWCRRPPAPNSHDREDLVPAPPGFVLAGRGIFRPIHFHYRQRRIQLGANGIHLVGGVPSRDFTQLPSGGIEVSCGCFTVVELRLDEHGELLYETTFWKPHKPGDVEVTEDI